MGKFVVQADLIEGASISCQDQLALYLFLYPTVYQQVLSATWTFYVDEYGKWPKKMTLY